MGRFTREKPWSKYNRRAAWSFVGIVASLLTGAIVFEKAVENSAGGDFSAYIVRESNLFNPLEWGPEEIIERSSYSFIVCSFLTLFFMYKGIQAWFEERRRLPAL